MMPIIRAILAFVSTVFRSRFSLQFEIVALRHQLAVYQRTTKRRGLAPETVFSGRSSCAAGLGGGMLWFLSRQGP